MNEFLDLPPAESEPEQTPRAQLDSALRHFDDTLHAKYLEWEHTPLEEFRVQSQHPTKVGWTFTLETATGQNKVIHPRLSRLKGAACEVITYFPEVPDDSQCISFSPATPYAEMLAPEAALKHMAALLRDLASDMENNNMAVAERVER